MKLSKQAMTHTRQALRAIQYLRGLDPELPITQLQALFIISQEPGISMHDLRERTGMSAASTSRNTYALSAWSWLKKPGLGLVEIYPDPMDLRVKRCQLTEQGAKAIEEITALFHGKQKPTPAAQKEARA